MGNNGRSMESDPRRSHPDTPRTDRTPRSKHSQRRGHTNRHPRRDHTIHRPRKPLSEAQLAARRDSVPTITYPAELPVSARREEIAEAIANNQVVIVAGETGSGKTTQIPKICLELGRGITGMIGHTQPRRIAARTVAERIASELDTKIGREGVVGYQVRFTEEIGPHTLVKLMTDGILLAEIQSDPLLSRYDTIIVDEAHERSLNIDFILGYLARLLPQRPDLKVIITSATIDSERFATHFGVHDDAGRLTHPAPVVEVSGRTYPVEIRYRPLDPNEAELSDDDAELATPAAPAADTPRPNTPKSEPRDQVTGILEACEELLAAGPGDILVFLAGERDIRDTETALLDHFHRRRDLEIVPLYSRLSAAEQHRVFEPHTGRRIVLATNVAETSLTVPGIRYVVDPGVARISRYSNRTKVQRLPIEAVSQASANQRSGRCGRVADGIAIRLYSAQDFNSRPEYTEPEILRTSLASVILQMASLGLGDVVDFPFLDAPDHRAVRDGVQLLQEIGAIEATPARRRHDDASHRGPQLTRLGRRLARLPIDPRLGRMLLEAQEEGCASEVMVIVAALSIQDVRERPADKQEASDALHRRFADPTSDFLTYLNLWRYLRTQQRELSGSAFRRMCRNEFLHYLRVREWQDVHAQLRQLAKPLGLDIQPVELPSRKAIRAASEALERGSHAATVAHGKVAAAVVALGQSADTPDADAIHRSLLVGLLSNVGYYDERRRGYVGARGTQFTIWPGSGLRRKTYDWVMTAELVETSRLFARTVAKVDPTWVERAAARAGLLKRTFGEPYWSKRHGAAMVHERVLLYGMMLAADRPATLASVGGSEAREVAREMFIRQGLVEGQWHARHAFANRNRELLEELAEVERRRRAHGLLANDFVLYNFYDDRLPDSVTSAAAFDAWWKRERHERPELLDYTRELLLPAGEDDAGFPDEWHQGDLTLGVRYVFEPGDPDDGMQLLVPLEVLGRLHPQGLEWLAPGMRPELCVATIRALPKRVRRQLVPAPDMGARVWEQICLQYPQARGAEDETGVSAPEVTFRKAFTEAVWRLREVEISDEDWSQAQADLPAHLHMLVVALRADGGAAGQSRDLVYLQKQLAGQTEKAVRSAVRGAVAAAFDDAEQRSKSGRGKGRTARTKTSPASGGLPDGGKHGASGRSGKPGATSAGEATASAGGLRTGLEELSGLSDWPVGSRGLTGATRDEIPQLVESTGTAGLVVRGYPTLVRTGSMEADLRILPDANAQVSAHGEGVLALALARTALATVRVTSRWSAAESLALAASPYASTEALVEDMQLAAARVVAGHWESRSPSSEGSGTPLSQLRTRAEFTEFVEYLRQHLEDEVYTVAQRSAATLAAAREVDREVSRRTSLTLLNTLQEIREQRAALTGVGFVSATPPETLQHLPRYLQALLRRLEAAEASPTRDAALAFQVQQALESVSAARARAAALPADPVAEATLVQARWMVEELRVSLFAQTLGTPHKVSLKRIQKLCAGVAA